METLDEQIKFVENQLEYLKKNQNVNWGMDNDYKIDAFNAILESLNRLKDLEK
jgi:hypothetical protein